MKLKHCNILLDDHDCFRQSEFTYDYIDRGQKSDATAVNWDSISTFPAVKSLTEWMLFSVHWPERRKHKGNFQTGR